MGSKSDILFFTFGQLYVIIWAILQQKNNTHILI